MDSQEKLLYHQIHPLKLLTDWITVFIASYLLWEHRALPAFAIGFIPSIIVTALLVRFANLESLKASAFGKYIAKHMTRRIEVVRFAGLAVWWTSAWFQIAFGEAVGIAIILAAWGSGIVADSNSDGVA